MTERLDQVPSSQNRHAVMLAGPPGAGKSHLRAHQLTGDIAAHLIVDPDDIKRWLLREAVRDGSLEGFLKPREVVELEQRGEMFFPMELSALVHLEAVQVAEKLKAAAVDRGLPVVIDGVLSDAKRALAEAKQFEGAGYGLEVVCLDVSPSVSEHQIRKRWRQAYQEALTGRGDLLGGRWVPSSFSQHVLNGPDGRSLPAIAAECVALEVDAVKRYRVFTRAAVGAPTILAVDKTRLHPGAPLIDTQAAKAVRTARPLSSRRFDGREGIRR